MHLQSANRPPCADVRQRTLAALAKGRFGREDDPLGKRGPDQAFKKYLPGGISQVDGKWQVAPNVNASVREAKLNLFALKQLRGGGSSDQEIGVRSEAAASRR
jgi:hypothetical protein